MGDINKLYDNIKQLAGGKIEVGTVEQFTKALGNQDTAKKIYGNLSTVLTKDQIGSENDFLSFVQPSGVLRAPKQNFGIVPSIKMDQPEETTISKTETVKPDYIQKEAPLQIKDLKQNNSLNPNALGGLEKEIGGVYQNNIGIKIGDEHILPIGGGYENTRGKSSVDVQLNRPKTEMPTNSVYGETPQLEVLKLKTPEDELKEELQKAQEIYKTSNGKDLFNDEINSIIDSQLKGESYNQAGHKEDKAEAPKTGILSTYVGSLIPKFFAGAYGTIGNTAGFARDFFPMLAQSVGLDVKTPSATDFQRDMGILSKKLNEISEINGDKSIKELHKEGDYLGIAAKVGKDIVGITPEIIASGSMGGVGFFAANASEEKYDALKLDNVKDQNKALNAVATGVISGVTMKLALEGMPSLLPYAGKLVTKYGTDEATKLISKSVYGGIATALKHSQSYVLPAAMAVQGMADTYANNVIDYVSGVSNNDNFTQGVQEAGWSGLATGIGFGAKGVLSHKSTVNAAKENFENSESRLVDEMKSKGLSDGEVADAINLLRFSRTNQEKQGVITKLNNEITKPDYNSKDFSKTEEELIKTSDLLNSYVKSFDTYKSISYKFDKNNEVDRILAQQYLSDNTAPTAEQSNYNANQSQLEAQNPIQSEKIKAEQKLVDLSNKTTGTIQTVKLKDDSEIQIANGTPIFKEDGTFDAEKTGIITHNPKDENGNPVLNEDGTPKILVVDPNSIMSLVSETPVQEAQAEAGSQIDQAVISNQIDNFYPKDVEDYEVDGTPWRISVNPETNSLTKQELEINGDITYEVNDPINITDEEYSQISGKPIPTQGGETEPVLSTEPIVSTEPAPVQDNEVVQDGGSTTEPAPVYPTDKNGNVDFKAMSDQQIFNHTKETKGEEAAHSLIGRQITRLQAQIQDNTRATNKHNEETNKLLAKAKTMQDEVAIQAKQDAKEVSLKEEYTTLNSKLGELQSLLPKVEAPAPVETPKVVTTRPEILQLQKEQAKAKEVSSEQSAVNSEEAASTIKVNAKKTNQEIEKSIDEIFIPSLVELAEKATSEKRNDALPFNRERFENKVKSIKNNIANKNWKQVDSELTELFAIVNESLGNSKREDNLSAEENVMLLGKMIFKNVTDSDLAQSVIDYKEHVRGRADTQFGFPTMNVAGVGKVYVNNNGSTSFILTEAERRGILTQDYNSNNAELAALETTTPEAEQEAQANLDSPETLTPNLATSSEVLQPNVDTSNEVQETSVIEESSVAKPKETQFQKRAKALGEYIDMKDYILRIIAGGQKIKWKGGLESEFRGSNAERLQRRNYIDETNGLTPTELAHQIWNDYGENGNNGEIPGVYNMSDGEILDEVHEVLRTVKSNSDALSQAEERRTIGTYDPTPEEAQIIDAFDDEIFAAVLGITNFTPEQLTTLNEQLHGWSEYIQHEQNSINPGTMPTSESNSTEGNASSAEGSRTEEVKPLGESEKQELLRNTKFIETGETRIDKDYDIEDAEYEQRKVYVPIFVNKWDYAENTDPDIEKFYTLDEALKDLNIKGDMSEVNAYYTPSKETSVELKEVWLDRDGNEVEESDKNISYYDWAYENKNNQFVKEFGTEGSIEIKTFDGRESTARELESKVYFDLNKSIIKEYNGLKIKSNQSGKYRTIAVENSKGEEVGSIKLRIADHSYNPKNNDADSRNGNFISIEIANKNETKGRFNGSYGIQFDGENTFSEVVESVNKRIIEIIDGWNIKSTEEVSKEEQFNLTPAKDFEQFETNINWFLKNYGSREMAAIQVELYLNEKPEFGKEYIAKHGITTTDELKIYLGKLQAKLRAGKGNERKAVRSEIAKEKTERNVDEVIKLALEAEAEMQEAIRQSDLKGNSTEQKGTKENSSVLSTIKNGSIVTYEGKQYTINGITSDGKFVDLYEGDNMIHEDIPVESVSNLETLQQSDKTKLSETNNEQPDNQKIAKTENVSVGDRVRFEDDGEELEGVVIEPMPYNKDGEVTVQVTWNNGQHHSKGAQVFNKTQKELEKVSSGNKLPEQAEVKPEVKNDWWSEYPIVRNPKNFVGAAMEGEFIKFTTHLAPLEKVKKYNSKDEYFEAAFKEGEKQPEQPIKQLGGGQNVYFETNNLRLNEYSKGGYILNITRNGETIPDANIVFKELNEAMDIAKKIDKLFPKGVPAALDINKWVEQLRNDNNDVQFQVIESDNKLVVLHNIRAEGILNVDKLGALPMPSLAITKHNMPLTGYGEITLIGDKRMVDPQRGTRAFGADIYSARYPELAYTISKQGEKVIQQAVEILPVELQGDVWRGIEQAAKKGKKGIVDSNSLKTLFLTEQGKLDEILAKEQSEYSQSTVDAIAQIEGYDYLGVMNNAEVRKQLTDIFFAEKPTLEKFREKFTNENGILNDNSSRQLFDGVKRYLRVANRIDRINTYRNASDYIVKNNMEEEWRKYAAEFYDKLGVKEEIFKGYNNQGFRKYVAHTIDNVMKAMKTKNLRGAEQFFYGAGSVRARIAPEFKSIADIKANADKLTDNETFEKVKTEIDNKLTALNETLDPFFKTKGSYRGSFTESLADEIVTLANKGQSESFSKLSKEARTELVEFIEMLKNAPTEYFEAKPTREVYLSEFTAAVVPADTNPKVIEVLENSGLKVERYTDNRAEVVQRVAERENVQFQTLHTGTTLTPTTTEAVADTVAQLLKTGLAKEVKMVTPEEMTAVLEGNEQLHAVYHGSPHSFDQFSLAHIGTGEGAQAYGYGLYFTDLQEIARQYAGIAGGVVSNKLYQLAIENGFDSFRNYETQLDDFANSVIMNNGDFDKALSNTKIDISRMPEIYRGFRMKFIDDLQLLIDKVGLENLKSIVSKNRNLYAVELHEGKQPGEYDYLRWEKPVSSEVKEKIFKHLRDENVRLHDMGSIKKFWDGESSDFESGDNMYGLLSNLLGSQKEASEFLLRAGIDGIQYPANHTTGKANETDFNYVVFDPSAITIKEKVQFMRKPDGTIYGFVKDGVVYLNSEKPNLNTPIHEFGHLFTPIIKSEHPEFYQKGVELIKESPYYDQVKNDPNYSNLDEDGIIDEAMNQAIGDKGEKVVEKGLFERLKEWINGVWERIGAKFGIKNLTSEQIEKLTLNDWTDVVNSELLNGKKLDNTKNSIFAEKTLKEKQLDIINESNPMLDDYHTGIRSVADIKTLEEAISDPEWDYDEYNPDYTKSMAQKAIETGKVTVYSSNPIKQGVFVSPSKMEAESYSGNGKIYAKEVNTSDVAWIDPTQGQYAEVKEKQLPTTIDVDGIQRPTTNSTGKPIHSTEEGIGNFWKWFKDSKIVDESGRPLVVYHGTTKDFNSFDQSKGNPVLGGGMYFSNSKNISDKFAGPKGNIFEVYLKIENPNYGTFNGSGADMQNSEYRDGGIFTKNNTDKYANKGDKEYIVFSPTQIKSATGNDGSFSENNANFVEEKQIAYDNEQEAIQKTIDFVSSERPTRIPLDNSRGYAEIHKRSVVEGFKESGYVDFVGRKINSIDDVVDMWNIHRSPYIEKSHIIFVKDGSIVGTTATTLNKVGITAFGKVEDIETLYNKFGADGMYLLHNHPSGNHNPSSGDIQTTQKIKDLLPEVNLIGHIVIDHDKYSYIDPTKDGYKEFEQKNSPAKLFYERELVGNNPQKRLFEISKALLNGEGLKGAIIYLSPKLDINAYDVFPEGATQETIAELTKQGLKNNLGQVAIITHDGTFDKDWKVPANVVDVIDTKNGYSTYFENEQPDTITSNDILKLWEPTTNYPKPQPPVFTSADTLVDQARKMRDHEEALQRWQERQIVNLATQNGERLSPATISKLNKDINSVTSKLWEGWADAALPIKEFQKFLEKNGVPISDNDNYYMRLTTVPSRIEYRFNQFKEEIMKPFIATLKAIEKNGFTYDDITTYTKLKHGPEYTANILVRNYTEKIEAERAKIEDVTDSKDWTTKNQKLDQKLIDFKSAIFDHIEANGIDLSGRDAIEKRIGKTKEEFVSNFELKNRLIIDKFWKQNKEINNYSVDEEVRGGMKTKEWADGIKGMFDYYIPFKGHRDPTAETTWDYSMEHGDFFFSAVKKGKGRTSESDDPFSVMESTVRSMIGAAEQNLQLQSIRRLALKDTTGSMTVSKTWFVKVGEDENGNPEFKVADEVPFEDTDTNETYNEKVAKFEEKMKELKSKGEAYQSGSERLKLGLWIKPTNEREHEVVVKSNGESYTIRFHTSPRVPQAINGTNMRFYEGTFGAVLDGLGWATRHMSGFKTLWRPAFILVTNPLRDIHAGLNLAFIDEGAKFTGNVILNFRHAQAALLRRSLNQHWDKNDEGKKFISGKYDKMLNDFMVLGGKTGISKIMELKEIQKSIESQMKNGINPVTEVFNLYKAISDITENQMRFAVYITAIEKGYSSLKATSMAKEATLNFDRKGNGRNGLRELKANYAFINVGFQAIDNIYSKSTKNTETKKRALLAIAANVLSGSLLVAAVNTAMCALFGWDEDKWLEDFSKRSSFARNANFTIWTPDKLIDIPLGQEFRMYHGLGMDLMMMAHGKVSVMETSMNMIKGLSSQLPYNPIESSLQGSWASAMPDFASPLAELAANKSWLGYGIYKQNQDEAAPGYTKIKTNKKGEPYAPEVMIKLSKWLNEGTGGDAAEAGWLGFVNPDIADHLLGGYFAGIYEQPLTLLEATLSDKEGSLIKELTPRAILKNTADIQSRDTGLNEKYYKAKDEAEKVDKLIGRAEKAIELLDKKSPDYEAQKEKYQSKIDRLKTDELYNIQGTQKTISALEKYLDEVSPEEQVKTEKEISELKKNIVKISSGEKVDPKNYTEYISEYYGTVKKIEEYKAKRVLGGEKSAELEKISGKLYASPGKMKSIHSVINLLEKDTKKNPSNREKNEAQIITLIKKL